MSALPWEWGPGCLSPTAVTHGPVGRTPLRLEELTTARAPSLCPSPTPAGHVQQQLTALMVAPAGTWGMRESPSGARTW